MLKYYKSHNFIIYKHTTPSGKCYIGYTQQPKLSYRARKNGIGYRYNVAFWNAICKYGWDNITHEILEEHLTFEQANERERYYIALYKSNNKNFGYNLTEGGSNPNCTPEIREKIRNTKIGKRYYRGNQIYQYNSTGELVGTYRSYHEAQDYTGINLYKVASSCRNVGIAKNYLFSHTLLSQEVVLEIFRKQYNTKYVYVYDILFDKVLPKINGFVQAAKIFNISKDTLCVAASDNPNRDLVKEFPHGYYFRKIPITKELQDYAKEKFYKKLHRLGDINRWKKERPYCEKNSN